MIATSQPGRGPSRRAVSRSQGRVTVSLVCMPWQPPTMASQALSMLKAMALQHGIPARVHYPNMHVYESVGKAVYDVLTISAYAAEIVFAPALYELTPGKDAGWFAGAAALFERETGRGRDLFEHLALHVVPRGLHRAVEDILASDPAVVGFAMTYNQCLSTLAAARYVKARRPDVAVVVGGAATFSTSGAHLVEAFRDVDIAFLGEAEHAFIAVVRAMVEGTALDRIPGIAFRDGSGQVVVNRGAAVDPVDMDDHPFAVFSDYFEVRRALPLEGDPWLPFEGSRGCWWGAAKMCTFCGLNGETVAYRPRSPARVIAELREQFLRHGVRHFSATDNILPKAERGTLLAAMAALGDEQGVPFMFYYQIKSHVTRGDAAAMQRAGLLVVQPGIEAFDDKLLALMSKGATTATQIECLRNLEEQGIQVIYGVLHGFPGEEPDDYLRQVALVPRLRHLPPPSYFSPVLFDRFSPYQRDPARYGVDRLVAPPPMRLLYPDERIDVDRLTKTFEGIVDRPATRTAQIDAAIELLRGAIQSWQRDYRPGTLVYVDRHDGSIGVRDARAGAARMSRLDGIDAEVFRACASPMRSATLHARGPHAIAAADRLVAAELVCEHGGWLVTVPVRVAPQLVLALVGESCVGKTTLCELARTEHGLAVFRMEDVLLRELGREFYELPPRQKLALRGEGESLYHFALPFVRDALAACEVLVVDSLKAARDLDVLRAGLPVCEVRCVRIEAAPEARAARFQARNRPGDEATLEAKDRRLHDIGLHELIARADHVLSNRGSRAELSRALGKVLTALRGELQGAATGGPDGTGELVRLRVPGRTS